MRAQRLHLRRSDVEIEVGEGPRDAVQQSDPIRCFDVDHRGVTGRGVVERHGGALEADGGAPPTVRANAVGQSGLDREPPLQRTIEVGGDVGPRRLVTQPVDDAESRQRLAVGRRVRDRLEHVEAAKREHAGDAAEDAGPIVGDDGDDAVARFDAMAAGRATPTRSSASREQRVRDGRELLAPKPSFDPGDERTDELGFPRTPRGRPGRGRVSLGQRREEMEHDHRPDRVCDEVDRRIVVEITAAGHLAQQQVMPNQRLQHLDVTVVAPDATTRRPRPSRLRLPCGRRNPPCRDRAAGPRAPRAPAARRPGRLAAATVSSR